MELCDIIGNTKDVFNITVNDQINNKATNEQADDETK